MTQKYLNTKIPEKIAIIGPYPPPFGGISIHIHRMLAYIDYNAIVLFNENGNSSDIKHLVDYRKSKRFYKVFLLVFKNFKLIHHHTPDNYTRLILSFLSRFGKKVYLHVHGDSFIDFINKNTLWAKLLTNNVRYLNFISCNEKNYEFINNMKPKSNVIIDAFIPPKYDQFVFNEFKNNFRLEFVDDEYLAFTMGWFKSYNNEDLYGFDIMAEALKNVKSTGFKLKIISSNNGIVDSLIYKKFIERRKELEIDNDFIILNQNPAEIWPAYLITDLFIRATNTDGSSVSVKEALWFESKVIASDIVDRPQNTILFKNRDVNDLTEKIIKVICQLPNFSKRKELIEAKISSIKHKKFNYQLFSKIYGFNND